MIYDPEAAAEVRRLAKGLQDAYARDFHESLGERIMINAPRWYYEWWLEFTEWEMGEEP